MGIIESGFTKFKLIGDAEAEHWSEFRGDLDKLTVSFVIASTDNDSPHSTEEAQLFLANCARRLRVLKKIQRILG